MYTIVYTYQTYRSAYTINLFVLGIVFSPGVKEKFSLNGFGPPLQYIDICSIFGGMKCLQNFTVSVPMCLCVWGGGGGARE